VPERISKLRVVALAASALAAGCGKSAEATRVGTIVGPEAGAEPAQVVAEAAAPPLPPDVDVKSLERQLHCPGGRHANACRILRAFDHATQGIGQAPSGQGRFVGNEFRVDHGVEKRDIVMLLAANAPAASVGPTDIPLRVAMAPLPKDKRRDAGKLARALAHGDTPPSSNKALAYAKTWTSENGRIAMATAGHSVELIAEEATYIRQAGQRVLVIKMKPALPGVATPPGDGTYAELWAVTW
jgi:hypothetical protein